MRIVVTRAEPEASRTAARIDAAGGTAILAPLLTIAPMPCTQNVGGVQALLFSSANGVRAFGDAPTGVIALTVGDATASAARNAGYRDVRSADGDSRALAALAIAELQPSAGKLIHISGANIASDLCGELQRAGFEAERRIAYEARAVDALPQSLVRRLGTTPQSIDRVMFHSARAAEIFTRLARLEAKPLTAVCLSENVAKAASNAEWAHIIVAPRPREDALLQAALTP
ncbi:MAG: uroporphyrinogen-III synthase [Caulobacterales bacterium]